MELLIFGFTFLQRSLNRILFPDKVNFDSYFHRFVASLIRDNNFFMPKEQSRLVITSPVLYPTFYHLIIAFFPKGMLTFVDRHLNPLLDALFGTLLYVVVEYITGSADQALLAGLTALRPEREDHPGRHLFRHCRKDRCVDHLP